MIIQKFGGSHFIDLQPFNNFLNILNHTNDKTVIVVSALGKTTRMLEAAAYASESRNRDNWEHNLAEIEKFHTELVQKLFVSDNFKNNINQYIFDKIETLKQYFVSIEILEELTQRTLDSILALGEEIALYVFTNFLQERSIDFSQIDAREIIATDDNFTDANPNMELIHNNINEKLIPLFEKSRIILTQGFIGSTDKGETTTMGFESSNLTAVLLSYSLNAKEIIIWTNIEGVYVADPKIIDNPRHIPHISFADAKLSAAYGNKLFYPKMLQICEKYDIRIYFKSIFNPEGKFTILKNEQIEAIPMMNILDGLSLMQYNGIQSDSITLTNEEIYPEFFRNFKLFTHNPENIKLLLVSNNNISFWTDLHLEHFGIPKHLINNEQSIIYILNVNASDFFKYLSENADYFAKFTFSLSQVQQNVLAIALKSDFSREVATKINEFLLTLPK